MIDERCSKYDAYNKWIRVRNKITGHWGTFIDDYFSEAIVFDNPPKRFTRKLKKALLTDKNWTRLMDYQTITRDDKGGLVCKEVKIKDITEDVMNNDIASGIMFKSRYDAELFIHKVKKGVENDGQ